MIILDIPEWLIQGIAVLLQLSWIILILGSIPLVGMVWLWFFNKKNTKKQELT
tara:strand:- start:765 stop:923 length:159 start_codon:yes stop_codon:yes gene_type:complete